MVGLPSDATAQTGGLGAAALKKLELARALATKPRLLLADESLGGLDATEMERAADLLNNIRTRMGITIVWVEHIMGVLMRIVDRVIVLITVKRYSRAHRRRRRSILGSLKSISARKKHSVMLSLTSVSAGYGSFQALFGVSL